MYVDCQLILRSLGDAVLILDKGGRIISSNTAATSITGYHADELENKLFSILYKEQEDNITLAYELEMSLKKGKNTTEGWGIKKDGTVFWREAVITPVYDDGREWIGFSCLLRDTTDKKQKELSVRRSEERYRLMVEGVKDYAIFMLDPTGNIITWNEGARKTKGYYADEIIGRHFSTFYTAEDLESKKPERELEIAIRTGKYEEEGWRIKKNGSVFWANIVITALFNSNNQLIGFSKVTRDLSERRENEEYLRQSEERYRALVEQVTDYGIFMLDEKGRVISWNEGARKMKGYTPSDIIGKYFSIFYPEEDILNDKPANELRIARQEGKYEEEGWRLRKDGTRFWASIVITSIYNDKKILIGFSKVTRDLTERKAAERALHESSENYRQLSLELKLINEELSYANKELEQFNSIVSHDLQEPIRTIKGFLQLIDMKLGEKQHTDLKNYISRAINAADHMKHLILNLLHYSQLDKGETLIEQVNTNELISEALQNVRSSVENSKAEISIENEVENISGDRIQLIQLMQNLISNALKFTKHETPRITIRSSRENGHVKFAVSDNGIGIDKANLHKVFEIFRRLNTGNEYPGTGIGLAICKKIVDRHRGRIWPESVPGNGTTFYVTLNEEAPVHHGKI